MINGSASPRGTATWWNSAHSYLLAGRQRQKTELISTNLSHDQKATMRSVFAEEHSVDQEESGWAPDTHL